MPGSRKTRVWVGQHYLGIAQVNRRVYPRKRRNEGGSINLRWYGLWVRFVLRFGVSMWLVWNVFKLCHGGKLNHHQKDNTNYKLREMGNFTSQETKINQQLDPLVILQFQWLTLSGNDAPSVRLLWMMKSSPNASLWGQTSPPGCRNSLVLSTFGLLF